ncbi:MAG: MATE family efflux transporter, partial [Clostridiales bacterium]|nr:MATE family efflux transporter [Clostridiales bacterium]
FHFSLYRKEIALGIPTALEFFCWNASNLVLIRFLNGISIEATAIYTLTFGVETIVFAIFSGNSRATMTIIGQKIGSKELKSANSFFNTGLAINSGILIWFIAIFSIFPKQILSIFTRESSIVDLSAPFLVMTALIMIPKSINVITGNTIRAYGNTRWMLFSQIIGSILVVSCSFVLIRLFHVGVAAIYITLFTDETVRAIINYIYYVRKYRSTKEVLNLT